MPNIIKIPFNSERTSFQEIDMDTCQRSPFQINRLVQISNHPDFDSFCCCQHEKKLWIVFPEFTCPFACLWMDKQGRMHGEKIGRRRVLHEVICD